MTHPIAILNTSIVTTDGAYTLTTITLEEARKLVQNNPIDSAVGHESTAALLTTLLGVEVPVNRQLFAQEPGQIALVCKLNGRPPEGKVLTLDELEAIGYSFKLLERVEPTVPSRILLDMDRCEHGRHKRDQCLSCLGGDSTGNLYAPPGTRIGTSLYGQAIVVPPTDRRRFFEEWYQDA